MRLWSLGRARGIEGTTLGRLTRRSVEPRTARADCILFGSASELSGLADEWNEYAAILCTDADGSLRPRPTRVVFGPPNLEYLGEGDVVALAVDGTVRVWYRRSSENNTILVTEQCNSYCLMCSQPPKERDDSDRLPLLLRLFELIDPNAGVITLSGGEPTLFGDGLLSVIAKSRDSLPRTGVHLLTNGRRFADATFARKLAAIEHPDLVLGIPLYSDIDWRHDYVVQSSGAYDETIAGLYNLASAGVRLELRVVVHKQTYERLPELAGFISRNLPFVEHVALMGLEMYGFAPRNLDVLWIDPLDYSDHLSEAVRTLGLSGMNVSIYNHQLCTLPRSLWAFARVSISDWKRVYVTACDGCGARQYCGGFFQSGTKRQSRAIGPLAPLSTAASEALALLAGMPAANSSPVADSSGVVGAHDHE